MISLNEIDSYLKRFRADKNEHGQPYYAGIETACNDCKKALTLECSFDRIRILLSHSLRAFDLARSGHEKEYNSGYIAFLKDVVASVRGADYGRDSSDNQCD